MNWEPISLAELKELISSCILKMSEEDIHIWNKIKCTPLKWELNLWGNEGSGFWVVAILKDSVIWYNDIEEGFNLSKFTTPGKIDDYFSNQDELQWIVHSLENSSI